MNGIECMALSILWGIYAGLLGGHFAWHIHNPDKSASEVFGMMIKYTFGRND